jgi:hypothetical protein
MRLCNFGTKIRKGLYQGKVSLNRRLSRQLTNKRAELPAL